MPLTSQQIRQYRAQAHALKPVVLIGNNGLTANVHEEIHQALEAHELIKIKIHTKDREYKKQLVEEICTKHQADHIQTLGHIATIYRKSQKKSKK